MGRGRAFRGPNSPHPSPPLRGEGNAPRARHRLASISAPYTFVYLLYRVVLGAGLARQLAENSNLYWNGRVTH